MTALEIYNDVEYIERVTNDVPINYKKIALLAMERYKNHQVKELESKVVMWYMKTKDEQYREFMGIEKQTTGQL